MYQVDCSVLLDGKKFYEMSLWNLYCRKRTYVILLAISAVISLTMISSAVPGLKDGAQSSSVMSAGFGLIFLFVIGYSNVTQIARWKRISSNEEWLKKTAKHIRITREQIVNYRVEAGEERKYEWSQVSGVYNRKDEIVICTKKDEQVMILEKSRLSESEQKFITDIVSEKHLWKTSMTIRFVAFLFVLIGVAGAVWIIQAFLK